MEDIVSEVEKYEFPKIMCDKCPKEATLIAARTSNSGDDMTCGTYGLCDDHSWAFTPYIMMHVPTNQRYYSDKQIKQLNYISAYRAKDQNHRKELHYNKDCSPVTCEECDDKDPGRWEFEDGFHYLCWKHDRNSPDGSMPLFASHSLTDDPDKHLHQYIDYKDPYTMVFKRMPL